MFGRFLGASDNADRQQRARDLSRTGLDSLREGNLQQARTDFQKAVGLEPKNPELRGYLGTVLAGLDLLTEADKEFQTAIKLNAVDEWLRYAHGQLLESMLRPEEAAAEYRVASRLDPASTRSLASLAVLAAKRDELETAESYVLAALERNDSDSHAWASLAEIHLSRLLEEQGDLDRGVQLLTDAYAGSPKDGSLRTALDRKMLRRNKVSQGIEIYRRLARLTPAEQTYYREYELRRLKSAATDVSSQPGSEQWLDVMYPWLLTLKTESSAATAILSPAALAQPAVAAVQQVQIAESVKNEAPVGALQPAMIGTAAREDEPPPAVIRAPNEPDGRRRLGIAQLEIEVASDPQNSKLRRDLSILYLQAGRLADAKAQAREAEVLQRQRHVAGRVAT